MTHLDNVDETRRRLVAVDRSAATARRRVLTRRTFLGASLAAAGAATLPSSTAAAASPWQRQDPFRLGVASGDPTSGGVVLWTKLAIDALAEDGAGAMPSQPIPVEWQIAGDPRFQRVLRKGTAVARPESAHSVHVELEDLAPGREYFYRFRVGRHVSETGRTLTMPKWGDSRSLRMIAVSCTHYEGGYFTAYRHAAAEQPDLVFELGDYIYEGGPVAGRPRVHPGASLRTLADYRRRYALYKNEAETQELHAVAPWIVTWDDHEVTDNWAGIYPKSGVASDVFMQQRTAAFQAYYENMPLRRANAPRGTALQLFRRFQWGDLATFHVLDTRQYRDLQAGHDGGKTWWFSDLPARDDPNRTLTGKVQEKWLLGGLASSAAAWQVMAQGDFFSQRDITAGPVQTMATDGWDGYRANRNAIRDGWAERGVKNAVVLSGDVHMHCASEIKADFDDPGSANVGVELVTTSVTSGGDGTDTINGGATVLAENQHIKYLANRRGYISMTLDYDQMRADFKTMPYVTSPGAPISTDRSYVIPAGEPSLNQVSVAP
jgi:alkaline phosphatase D